jgi:hypothetical protein
MKRLVVISFVGLGITMSGVVFAAPASAALPTILFLPGETVPVELKAASNSARTELRSEVATFDGEGYTYLDIYETVGGPLGQFNHMEMGFTFDGMPCNTPRDGRGEVLYRGEWHYVRTNGGNLELLMLIPAFRLECERGVVVATVEGDSLSSVSPANKEVGTSEHFTMKDKCKGEADEPELTKWLNGSGEEETAKLTVTLAGKRSSACENETELSFTPSKMIEIMG